MLKKYYVTLTFTLLSIIFLFSSFGRFEYRLSMVAMNVIVGFSLEYLVNNKVVAEKYNFWKGMSALLLLVVNVIWILVTWIA